MSLDLPEHDTANLLNCIDLHPPSCTSTVSQLSGKRAEGETQSSADPRVREQYGSWMAGAVPANSRTRISAVRRMFALFVTFDLLLCTLLWLVSIVLMAKSIDQSLTEHDAAASHTVWSLLYNDIVHYTPYTSMFDVVCAAFVRFLCLIVVYVIFVCNHWAAITLTVSATSLATIAKTVYFHWGVAHTQSLSGAVHAVDTRNNTFEAMLLIVFFILGWIEMWLLDSRVLPQERKAQMIIERHYRYLQQLARHPHTVCGTLCTSRYYSPLTVSPRASPPLAVEGAVDDMRALKCSSLRLCAEENCRQALDLLSSSSWREQCQLGTCDMLYSAAGPRCTLHLLRATVGCSARALVDWLFRRCDNCTLWNTSLGSCERVLTLDTDCFVRHQRTASAALLTHRSALTRHFLALTLVGCRQDMHYCSYSSVEPESLRGLMDQATLDSLLRGPSPECDGVSARAPVYGILRPSIITIQADDGGQTCSLNWLLNCDPLVPYVPHCLLDRATRQTACQLYEDITRLVTEFILPSDSNNQRLM